MNAVHSQRHVVRKNTMKMFWTMVVAMAVVISTAHTQTQVSWWAFTDGLGKIIEGNTVAHVVVGQSIIGRLEGPNIAVGGGFLYNPVLGGPSSNTGIMIVNTVSDTGEGSLRHAIETANTTAGLNIIRFDIPGSGVHTIVPTTPLQPFTDPVLIDGYSQPGASENTNPIGEANNAQLRIQLTGPGIFSGVPALVLRGGSSTVRGLVINNFGIGISIDTLGDNTIQGNYIGTDSIGNAGRGNQTGIRVRAPNNRIGGTVPSSFNVISANSTSGVFVGGTTSSGNLVYGNYIGTTASGVGALPNGSGVWLEAGGNFIGGGDSDGRNVILQSNNPAIYLSAGYPGGNTIRNNYLGTNAQGTAGLGQGGMYILTRNNIIRNNVGCGGGILIQDAGGGNIVRGNLIGLSADGTTLLGNANFGIDLLRVSHTIIGGLSPDARNVITVSGTAVSITYGDSNTVQGNYIGTNAAGTIGLIQGGSAGSGIQLLATAHNLVGGTAPGAANVVANCNAGISITAASRQNTVQGNLIGTNVLGTTAIPNRTRGIAIVTPQGSELTRDNLIGGDEPGAGNIISGNIGPGIFMNGVRGTTIQGNRIGLTGDGASPLPNSVDGIELSLSDSNMIGGLQSGTGNLIAFNGVGFTNSRASGIKMWSGSANSILGNAIYANQRLGIDLVGGTEDILGVTANDSCDADTGPNNLQNNPALTSAVPEQGGLRIQGVLITSPFSTSLVQFFSTSSPDTSGHGGGRELLGSIFVTTDGNCVAPFDTTLPVSVASGHFIAGTATDASGNTSEFSLSLENGTTSVRQPDETPKEFALLQNYPNPFNPTTVIQFAIKSRELVVLRIFDVLGREVATLVHEVKKPGTYTASWNAAGLASGVYFYKLEAGQFIQTKKLLLLQ